MGSHGWEVLFFYKFASGTWSRLSSGVLPKLKLIDFGNAQSSTNKASVAAQLQLLRHENRFLIGTQILNHQTQTLIFPRRVIATGIGASQKGGAWCHCWIFGFRLGRCFGFCKERVCVTCGSLVLFWAGAVLHVALEVQGCVKVAPVLEHSTLTMRVKMKLRFGRVVDFL